MSLHHRADHPLRATRTVVFEFGMITAMLLAVYLWQRFARGYLSGHLEPPPMFDGLLFSGLVNGGILLAGILLLVGAYSRVRNVDVGFRLPSSRDVPVVGLAVAAPVFFAGFTKLVGTITGVPYNALTMTSVAADAPLRPILLLLGLTLFVGVPALVAICQVLIQGTFERTFGSGRAIASTTVVAGFVLASGPGGLAAVPGREALAGAVAFVLLLWLALYGHGRFDRDLLRYLASVPVLSFSVFVAVAGISGIEHVAGGTFVAAQFAVLGVAAYAYDRTSSLVPPALAYTAFLVSNRAIVVVFEAGMQSW